jgi:TolA-binding protein
MDWPGIIPAHALHPLLDLGEALVGLRRGRFKEALTLLEGVVDQHSDSVFAPEALWWLGAVQQVAKGDGEALALTRQLILERYPGSAAALRV